MVMSYGFTQVRGSRQVVLKEGQSWGQRSRK